MTLAPKATTWKKKFAQREAAAAVILSLGDSMAEPVGATLPEYGWTALAARDLGRRIADDQSLSTHTISCRAPHAVGQSGTFTDYDARNPHVVELQKGATAAGDGTQSFFNLYGYRSIDVFYAKVSGYSQAPQFQYAGMTGRGDLVNERVIYGPGAEYCLATVPNFPGGNLDIFPAAASGSRALVYGLHANRGFTPDLGAKWVNWARSGWTSQDVLDHLTTSDFLFKEMARALTPDMLHLSVGPNDLDRGVTVTQLKQNIRDIYSWFRTNVNPSCGLLLTTMPYADLNYPETSPATVESQWNTYMDAVTSVGAEYPEAIVIDWRGFGKQGENQALYARKPDGTIDEHWNNFGHRFIADVMSNALRPS